VAAESLDSHNLLLNGGGKFCCDGSPKARFLAAARYRQKSLGNAQQLA
jgi:hypothetical protein